MLAVKPATCDRLGVAPARHLCRAGDGALSRVVTDADSPAMQREGRVRQAKGSPLGRRRATRSRRRAWPPAVALGEGLAHPSRTRSVAAPARRSYRRFASSSRSVRIAAKPRRFDSTSCCGSSASCARDGTLRPSAKWHVAHSSVRASKTRRTRCMSIQQTSRASRRVMPVTLFGLPRSGRKGKARPSLSRRIMAMCAVKRPMAISSVESRAIMMQASSPILRLASTGKAAPGAA